MLKESEFHIDEGQIFYGLPIRINANLEVYPFTLEEIFKMTEEKYKQKLGLLFIEYKENDLGTYENLLNICIREKFSSNDEEKKVLKGKTKFICDTLSEILRRDIRFSCKLPKTGEPKVFFYYNINQEEHYELNKEDYDKIKDVLIIQNNLDMDAVVIEEEKEDWFDLQLKKFQNLEKEEKQKAYSKDKNLSLHNKMMNLCCMQDNGIDIFNVGKLTYAQFSALYKKSMIKEEMEKNFLLKYFSQSLEESFRKKIEVIDYKVK